MHACTHSVCYRACTHCIIPVKVELSCMASDWYHKPFLKIFLIVILKAVQPFSKGFVRSFSAEIQFSTLPLLPLEVLLQCYRTYTDASATPVSCHRAASASPEPPGCSCVPVQCITCVCMLAQLWINRTMCLRMPRGWNQIVLLLLHKQHPNLFSGVCVYRLVYFTNNAL